MDHSTHTDHAHHHDAQCAHTAVKHDDHTDYLHDGHLHHEHADHIDEHVIEVSSHNPVECTASHDCGGHDSSHKHGSNCEHEPVPHADHIDYLVAGHLHNAHGSHCDNHGELVTA